MQCYIRKLAITVALFSFMQPGVALSQTSSGNTLPWNQPSASHQHHKNTPSQSSVPRESGNTLRDEDDRKLNSLATEYYAISHKSKHPVEKLKNLQKRVKSYQSMLKRRDYAGSADLIHDTVNLEHRIEAKRKKLALEEAQQSGQTTTSTPITSPAAVPPAPFKPKPAF